MKLFDATLKTLEHALDVRLERQTVLAGNLANVDTPGYQPKDLPFEAALAQASQADRPDAPTSGGTTHPAHLPVEGPTAAPPLAAQPQAQAATTGLDGNGVDVDKTMVELSRNGLLYGAAARAAGKKLSILRYVATDGIG